MLLTVILKYVTLLYLLLVKTAMKLKVSLENSSGKIVASHELELSENFARDLFRRMVQIADEAGTGEIKEDTFNLADEFLDVLRRKNARTRSNALTAPQIAVEICNDPNKRSKAIRHYGVTGGKLKGRIAQAIAPVGIKLEKEGKIKSDVQNGKKLYWLA